LAHYRPGEAAVRLNMTENGNVEATTAVGTPTLIKIAYTGS
jgi:hypothetical protein